MNRRRVYEINKHKAKIVIISFITLLTVIDYRGYGYYVILLAIPILLHKLPKKYFDSTFFLFLFWGITYGGTVIIYTGKISYGAAIQFIVNCPILYLLGEYWGLNLSYKRLVLLICLLIVAFSFIPIISVIKDILQNGFVVVGMDRNIPLIGINNEEGYIAATGISTRLLPSISMIGLLFYQNHNDQLILKKYMIAYGLIAFICAVRIQSRTSVILVILVILFGLYRQFRSKNSNKIIVNVVILLTIVGLFRYLIIRYSTELVILNRFENESNIDGGGRLERLLTVLELLPHHLFGGMFLNKNISYAHNFWIDCGRVAGIVPLFLLVIITIVYFSNLRKINKIFRSSYLLCSILNYISLSFLIAFFAEPILEGIPMLFNLFVLFLGLIVGRLQNKVSI